VCGSLYSPYLAVGRQVSAEANWHAIVTFAVVQIFPLFGVGVIGVMVGVAVGGVTVGVIVPPQPKIRSSIKMIIKNFIIL
jgi:hypothetical protein